MREKELAEWINKNYDNPLQLGFIFENMINDYVKGLVVFYSDNIKMFRDINATPIVKNPNYPFYVFDYGYMIWTFLKILKIYGVNENKLTLIERQFAAKNKDFVRNGRLFISFLEYYDITFRQKAAGSFFYVRNLYLEEDSNTLFLLNSIAVNSSALDSFLNLGYVSKLIEDLSFFKPQIKAYGQNVEVQLKMLRSRQNETIKVVSFSSGSGINRAILNL